MKRLIIVLVLLVAAAFIISAQQADDVAHGSERVSHERAGEAEGPHGGLRFLGLPFWVWKLVNMVLFFGFLAYLLAGPVKRAFVDRTTNIQQTAKAAHERRTRADQMARDIQERLSRLEGEVQGIRDRALSEGERQKRDLLAAADAEARKLIANAQSEIDNRLRHARTELTEYAGQLAAERAEQILRDKITPDDQRKLFEESLTEVEGAHT